MILRRAQRVVGVQRERGHGGQEARPGQVQKTKRQVGIGVAFGVGAGGVDVVRPAVSD
jgi:hypothetical protein